MGCSTNRKMLNTIRHTERAGYIWSVSTTTEDGHRISGYGVTLKQAIFDAHRKAKAYGEYEYPEFAQG
jgi:hypothetical protein